MIEMTLQGSVPSKKNAWRRPAGASKAYLPAQIQADIDALIIQAQIARHRVDLKSLQGELDDRTRLRAIVLFHVRREQVDLDNAYTTLLDVLQKAGVIPNDKYVRAFAVDEIVDPTKEEKVEINLSIR